MEKSISFAAIEVWEQFVVEVVNGLGWLNRGIWI